MPTHCIVIVVVTRALALRRRALERTCLSERSWKRPLTHMGMMASLLLPLPSRVNDLPIKEVNTVCGAKIPHDNAAIVIWHCSLRSTDNTYDTAVAVAKGDESNVNSIDHLQQLRNNKPLVHGQVVRTKRSHHQLANNPTAALPVREPMRKFVGGCNLQILGPAIGDKNVVKQKLCAAVAFAFSWRNQRYLAPIAADVQVAVNCLSRQFFAHSGDNLHAFS
jgi:hypothetical protein